MTEVLQGVRGFALTCSLPLSSSEGLMDHDAGVGQRVPLPLRQLRKPSQNLPAWLSLLTFMACGRVQQAQGHGASVPSSGKQRGRSIHNPFRHDLVHRQGMRSTRCMRPGQSNTVQ